MFLFNPRPSDIIYDIETYPNCFTFTAIQVTSGQVYYFEISDRQNDLSLLCAFINHCKALSCRWVGFNNIGFDYPVVHYIYQNQLSFGFTDCDVEYNVKCIYNKAMSIIGAHDNARFAHMVWESDWLVEQIDLYKIHHFDNRARATSLKVLEFNMRMSNVEDLPFGVGVELTDDQKDVLKKYNLHDCDATLRFYKASLEQIEFRESLTKKYNKNFMNHNDTKIGKDYFVMELEKADPGCCYQKRDGERHIVQTKREVIHIGDIILPYISFKRPEFANVLNWLKEFSITKTKGALEYLDVGWEMAINMNPGIIKVTGLNALDVPSMLKTKKYIKKSELQIEKILNCGVWLSDCKEDLINHVNPSCFKYVSGYKDQSGLNCIVDGFRFDFGTGGIHGSINPNVILSTENRVLRDIDVKSFYPWIAIANGFKPEHLGDLFCYLYRNMYNDRLNAQQNRQKAISAMLKLALNGVYGDSNSPSSPFFDPQYTMSVTINGQLLLCMLAEALMDSSEVRMIQLNTDGITVDMPRRLLSWVESVEQWWENLTNLTLESADYSRMFIRDVNNYIAEYTDGKLKNKGAYAWKTRQWCLENNQEFDRDSCRDWHKNHSAMIIPMAAEAKLVRNIDIETFVTQHRDVFDFFLCCKVPRSNTLEWAGKKVANTVRYYVSHGGRSLEKIMPPNGPLGKYKKKNGISSAYYDEVLAEAGDAWDERIHTKNKSVYEERRTGINTGWNVELCNDLSMLQDEYAENEVDMHAVIFEKINYEWYIKEASKLVNLLKDEDC